MISRQSVHNTDIETQDFGQNDDDAVDDNVDETIELHGHIIGMNLSPDHRLAHLVVLEFSPGLKGLGLGFGLEGSVKSHQQVLFKSIF